MSELTHLDEQGHARMVGVTDKDSTRREARAAVSLKVAPATWELLQSGGLPKGDALAVARVAGIMAAKRTSDLIPLCHPLNLTKVEIAIELPETGRVEVEARVVCRGQTGVEMEAMTAAAVTALTLYDMVKGVERGVEISSLRLLEKTGGKSGPWTR